MKAKLEPLNGKYYGTKITVTSDSGTDYQITIWDNGDYVPSQRELDGMCTVQEWIDNAWLPSEPNYEGGHGMYAKEACEVCDSHFESRETHELALQIIERLNA